MTSLSVKAVLTAKLLRAVSVGGAKLQPLRVHLVTPVKCSKLECADLNGVLEAGDL